MERTDDAPPDDALATSYMRKLLAMLALAFVARYAWFTDNCWSDRACRWSLLFTASGHPTPAGSVFKTAP